MDDLNSIEDELNGVDKNTLNINSILMLLHKNKPIVILGIIILISLLFFKPKMIKDDVTNGINWFLLIEWWVILLLLCYFSNYIFTKFQ